MIRVNLLGERAPVRRRRSADGAAVAIIIAMMGSLGWRHWTGGRAEARLESEIRSARSEETRVAATSTEIASLERTRAELQRQATLIEAQQSRRTIAVRIVDEVSRSMPAEAWLTRLEQDGTDLVIDGQCTSMTVLADLADNLEAAGFVKRPVAIVVSEIVDDALAASDLVRFSIKATLVAGGGRAR